MSRNRIRKDLPNFRNLMGNGNIGTGPTEDKVKFYGTRWNLGTKSSSGQNLFERDGETSGNTSKSGLSWKPTQTWKDEFLSEGVWFPIRLRFHAKGRDGKWRICNCVDDTLYNAVILLTWGSHSVASVKANKQKTIDPSNWLVIVEVIHHEVGCLSARFEVACQGDAIPRPDRSVALRVRRGSRISRRSKNGSTVSSVITVQE